MLVAGAVGGLGGTNPYVVSQMFAGRASGALTEVPQRDRQFVGYRRAVADGLDHPDDGRPIISPPSCLRAHLHRRRDLVDRCVPWIEADPELQPTRAATRRLIPNPSARSVRWRSAMGTYSGTVDPRGRAAAIAAVVAVHLALAFIILTGLNVRMVGQCGRAAEDIQHHRAAATAARRRRRPRRRPQQAKKRRRARPRRKPRQRRSSRRSRGFPPPSPIPAAKIAGTGSAPSSGAGTCGQRHRRRRLGQWAGRRRRLFAASRRRGASPRFPTANIARSPRPGCKADSVGVTIRVNPDGSVSNCRVARSSGDGSIDALMCQLTLRYIRFEPGARPRGPPGRAGRHLLPQLVAALALSGRAGDGPRCSAELPASLAASRP